MSLMPGFSEDLHKYTIRVFHVENAPTDDPFADGGTATEVYDTPEIPISGQKVSASESLAAGVEAANSLYRLYSGPGLHDAVTEKARVRMWAGLEPTANREPLGEPNIRSVVTYRGEHVEIEATLLNNA